MTGRCKDCAFWRELPLTRGELGECTLLGGMDQPLWAASTSGDAVQCIICTRPEFGCSEWHHKANGIIGTIHITEEEQ